MPADRWGVTLPLIDDLPAAPRGVVLHWTGGGHRANSVDLAAYHFVVEYDGNVRTGRWPVAANMCRVGGTDYAMHTGGFNSFRIGISAAGMKDYEGPDSLGDYPITEVQVERMVELAAYFLSQADLDPLDPANLCTHREVWTIHGVRGEHNHQKRDIEHLPFRPHLEPEDVGNYLRLRAASHLRPAAELAGTVAHVFPDEPDPTLAIPSQGMIVGHMEASQPSRWRRFLSRLGF